MLHFLFTNPCKTTSNIPRGNMTNLLSLPDAALSKSSEYLSAYTRLLFASAFESISTVVLPDRNSFAKLNLGRLGLNLARRLSDDDIRSMLSVIGAENITEFELGGCINITGEGLEPLRQSTSIVRIDLGGLLFPFSTSVGLEGNGNTHPTKHHGNRNKRPEMYQV